MIGSIAMSALLARSVDAFQPTSAQDVSITAADGKINVLLGGQLFTTLDYRSYDKPILYPIYSPSQISMTRDWPMDANTDGENHDHPHHKSLWFSHEINGVDFWSERGGVVKVKKIQTEFANHRDDVIVTQSDWIERGNDQSDKSSLTQTLLTDQTVYRFGGDQTSRWIDCQITFLAAVSDLRFEDTKEGLFAIRTHPDLRLTPAAIEGTADADEVFGHAVNSEGVTGKDIWGKRAKWILYFGQINDHPVSIAMYDHPKNIRHPTTWHARDYGLVAANPFGLHHFLAQEKGAGAYTVTQGDRLQLRYRVEFFDGIQTPKSVEEKFKTFAATAIFEIN